MSASRPVNDSLSNKHFQKLSVGRSNVVLTKNSSREPVVFAVKIDKLGKRGGGGGVNKFGFFLAADLGRIFFAMRCLYSAFIRVSFFYFILLFSVDAKNLFIDKFRSFAFLHSVRNVSLGRK
jgi:hypothetical protein